MDDYVTYKDQEGIHVFFVRADLHLIRFTNSIV